MAPWSTRTPWLAGGHNGLSNSEDPQTPEDPYPRVRMLRGMMNECGLEQTPIIMAGGVWFLREWEQWIDNPELGPIAFQFGTRSLLTKESPISEGWKQRLLTLKEGDVSLHNFSPTGFYLPPCTTIFCGNWKSAPIARWPIPWRRGRTRHPLWHWGARTARFT